jgi:TPR repeat protein
MKYIRKAADQGRAGAQYNFAVCLAEGRGVPIDLTGAAKYSKLAADQNDSTAQAQYGKCLEFGIGLMLNPVLATEFYRQSVSLDDPDGLNWLGTCLEFGRGLPKDLSRACDCYKKAAAKGNANAQFNYGFCLQNGLGDAPDLTESLKQYEMSIGGLKGPDESGAFEYARCLQYGLGFDVNLEAASAFYGLIASDKSKSHRYSFRCLRSLKRARLEAFPSPRRRELKVERQVYSQPIRNLSAPQRVSDYASSPMGLLPGQAIGIGGSSQVKVVRDRVSGQPIAIKYFSGPGFNKVSFVRETQALAALNHLCVLRIVGCAFPIGSHCAELQTEYAERGSLEDVLRRRKMKGETEFWTLTRIGIVICDIALGMRFVHSRGLIHRDLKPSNVLIRWSGRALIGDFGSSRFKCDDGTLTPRSEPDAGSSVTVHYAAPELFDSDAELRPEVDVWAFGLILYEMLAGSAVFPVSLSPFDVIRQLRRQHRPIIPKECGEYMDGLIRRCWSTDPSSRPSFDAILREFRDRQFAILPGAECKEIWSAVYDVVQWESDAGVWKS